MKAERGERESILSKTEKVLAAGKVKFAKGGRRKTLGVGLESAPPPPPPAASRPIFLPEVAHVN